MSKRSPKERARHRAQTAAYRRRDRAAIAAVRSVLACSDDACDPCGHCLLALRDVLGIGEEALRAALARLERPTNGENA